MNEISWLSNFIFLTLSMFSLNFLIWSMSLNFTYINFQQIKMFNYITLI